MGSHFQFPPWFTAKSENYGYLEQVRERLTRYGVALEFRHRSWFDKEHAPATLAFEGVHGFVNVTVDEPQGSANSIPAVWDVTNPKPAVIRLHGRNVATWNQKGLEASSERFNYDYSQEELTGLAESIRKVSAKAAVTHVVLNINYEDQGTRNAAALSEMLDLPYGATGANEQE